MWPFSWSEIITISQIVNFFDFKSSDFNFCHSFTKITFWMSDFYLEGSNSPLRGPFRPTFPVFPLWQTLLTWQTNLEARHFTLGRCWHFTCCVKIPFCCSLQTATCQSEWEQRVENNKVKMCKKGGNLNPQLNGEELHLIFFHFFLSALSDSQVISVWEVMNKVPTVVLTVRYRMVKLDECVCVCLVSRPDGAE